MWVAKWVGLGPRGLEPQISRNLLGRVKCERSLLEIISWMEVPYWVPPLSQDMCGPNSSHWCELLGATAHLPSKPRVSQSCLDMRLILLLSQVFLSYVWVLDTLLGKVRAGGYPQAAVSLSENPPKVMYLRWLIVSQDTRQTSAEVALADKAHTHAKWAFALSFGR